MQQEIFVHLFLGFLDAGKTRLIKEILEDPAKDTGERIMLVVCEEGEEEYEPDKFGFESVTKITLESKQELTLQNLKTLAEKHGAQRVIIEYNGMWELETLAGSLPGNWIIQEVVSIFDATTFLSYNQNMRQIVFEKIVNCDRVIFNRFKGEYAKMDYHKIVRGISRQNRIEYEYLGGKVEEDDIEDPMPFDVNAPVIEIADKDFAWFISDLEEKTSQYIGKTVSFKGVAAVNKKMPKGYIALGRFIMNCCAEDIQYYGLPVKTEGVISGVQSYDWLTVTAKIEAKYNSAERVPRPVLVALEARRAEPPEEEVATFY